MGAELAGLNWLAQVEFEPVDKLLVKGDGNLRSGGAAVRGAIAFPGAGKQRELADQQDAALDVLHREVHNSGLVIEDAQPDDLPAQPLDVLRRIGFLDGEQHDQSPLDGTLDGAVDDDLGFRRPLDDGSHQ